MFLSQNSCFHMIYCLETLSYRYSFVLLLCKCMQQDAPKSNHIIYAKQGTLWCKCLPCFFTVLCVTWMSLHTDRLHHDDMISCLHVTHTHHGGGTLITLGNSEMWAKGFWSIFTSLSDPLTYLWCRLWAECSGKGLHEASHTLPPGTRVQTQQKGWVILTKSSSPTLHCRCSYWAWKLSWFYMFTFL